MGPSRGPETDSEPVSGSPSPPASPHYGCDGGRLPLSRSLYSGWQRVGSVRVGQASEPVHAGRFGPVQPSRRFVP
eukprot:13553540-Alexandrium_andersonii.AAC.1